MNLRSKIFTNSLLLTLIPILLTAAAVYFLLLRSFDRRETEQREASIRESIAQVNYRGRSLEERVVLLAKTPSILNALERPASESRTDAAKQLLDEFLILDRYSLGIELIDGDGMRIVTAYKSNNVEASIGSRAAGVVKRTIRVGTNQTPVFKLDSDKFATSFAHVVGNETVLGAIIYTQDMRYFEEPLRNQVREGVAVTCFDELGSIWASLSSGSKSPPSADIETSILNRRDFEDSFRQLHIIGGKEYFETTRLLYNYRQTGSFEPLQGENWYLSLVETDTSPAGMLLFQTTFASIVIITVAGVFWMSAISAKRITKPIEQVSKATTKIARGEEDLELNISTGDEVEELAEAVKRMNSDLRDYQRKVVESARLAAMGEMTSEISHEIQNRISGVSLWLQHLDAEIPAEDERREYIDEMKLGLNGFFEMLSGLKAYYRKPQIEKSGFDLNQLIDEAVATAENLACKKEIEFAKPSGEAVSMFGDREKLKSVVINLLVNAVEASPEGGKVSVDTKISNDMVEIRVSDEGPGIRETEVQKVFYPFYTTKSSGSGLGLAISKNVIDAHNGTIKIEKTGPRGTVFFVAVPIGRK